MATAHRTGNKRTARRVNGAQTDFDEEVFGARGTGGAAGDDSEIEPVVRKVLGELLSDVSEELEAPEGEPPPAEEGGSSRAFTRAGIGGGATGAPDEDDEAVPPDVAEAVQAVMSELSTEQTQALASMFEAMGEASDGRPQEAAAMGFGNAAAAGISSADFRSLDQATARGAIGPVIRWIIRWLKGPGRKYWTQAVGAAKRGTKAFMAWKNRLPWPVRLAISGLGPYAVEELVKLIASQAGIAEARRTSAAASGPEPGEPDETEQAVRTVLADLLTKAAEELQSGEEESPDEEEQPSALAGDAGDLELESDAAARAEGERLIYPPRPIGPNHPIVKALRRAAHRLYAQAVRAAKGGPRSFNRWVNQLSDFNPIKSAIKALPNQTRAALIAWLARQNVPAGARSATATAGETEPAEIEQVVRRVLGQALTGSQSPSAIA